jgi:hypothetical protein
VSDPLWPPALLGMGKVVSEDSVRRGFWKMDEEDGAACLQHHLERINAPFLSTGAVTTPTAL